MNDYLIGLLTIPAAAVVLGAVYAVVIWTRRALTRWWLAPVEFSSKDWGLRARHAACVLAARRVWAMKLPGSRLLVYRSNVGGNDYKYGTYYSDTNELQRRAANVLLDEFDPR